MLKPVEKDGERGAAPNLGVATNASHDDGADKKKRRRRKAMERIPVRFIMVC
jgi:hypothetical protein